MPSKTTKQANTAKLAGAVKAGKFPKSKAGPAVKAMAKMPMDKLKHFMKTRESLSLEGKRKLLKALHLMREYAGSTDSTGNVGGETDISYADNLVSEDEFTAIDKPEQPPVAKTYDTKADFDSYVNQWRGIEMTSKELDAVRGFTRMKPTQQDKFFVKYENTDAFGTNSTTVIKKLREGNQFCWTAFQKYESAEEEGKPEGGEEAPPAKESPEAPETPEMPVKEANPPGQEEVTVSDKIRISKSITFDNDIKGSEILGNFLRKIKL